LNRPKSDDHKRLAGTPGQSFFRALNVPARSNEPALYPPYLPRQQPSGNIATTSTIGTSRIADAAQVDW
jgi:hypothetical protein